MSEITPPPFPGPAPQPPAKFHRVRNILLGCGLALLIGIGLVVLVLTVVCSGLNNMH
jgi:hypothetical protein